MQIKITKNQAEEIRYKLSVLLDNEDLQSDYKLTSKQAESLYDSIPYNGGTWTIPDFALEVVKGELENQADILRGIAEDCRAGAKPGQMLSNYRLANELDNLLDNLPVKM